MIDRFEILASKMRHLVSRNRWSARLLGYRPILGHGDEPGLILIQVDGLGEDVLRRALAEGKFPFLRHLIEDEGYGIHPLYSGMASNTPNFQAELFYGVVTAVPGFGFRDAELGRELTMNSHSGAAAIEKRLRDRGEGLLRGGSAWSDIFSGGADESHLCASTAGFDAVLGALNPLRVLGLVFWHGWSVVRVLANLIVETGLALWGFVKGTLAGRDFMQELRFIPERVAVSAVMREIVTAGACIDAERGLPIVHLNLLGYDEHAHRRGPDSGFALWTLKGLDRSIRRIWLAAHRSRWRDYQIWVYSDHGQEPVVSYPVQHKEDVTRAILRVYRRVLERAEAEAEEPVVPFVPPVSRTERSQWLRRDLPEWMRVPEPTVAEEEPPEPPAPEEPQVIHRGPVGFIYPPADFDLGRLPSLARALATEALVPTVMIRDGHEGARVWTRGQELRLPDDAAEIFGGDHPHLARVTEDMLRVVHHESAGAAVLLGWSRDGCLSFKVENGAHGGPGPRETSPFLILAPEMTRTVPPGRVLRSLDVRELVQWVLDPARPHLPLERAECRKVQAAAGRPTGPGGGRCLRLMTYNVHGCRGMDGRYSTQRISRVIARSHPDVICLQELDQSRTRSGSVDQVHEIAEQLEAEYHYHPVLEIDDGRFGNAVLSTYPLTALGRGPLPRLTDRLNLVDRGVLWVEVDLDGERVQIVNTHLSILRKERQLQVEALVGDRWLGNPRCVSPLLLAGDFNAATDSWTTRRIGQLLRDVSDPSWGEAVPQTWSSRIPVRRIDHVFASSQFRVMRVHAPRTRLSRVASDHLPLVVDLDLVDAPRAASGTNG